MESKLNKKIRILFLLLVIIFLFTFIDSTITGKVVDDSINPDPEYFDVNNPGGTFDNDKTKFQYCDFDEKNIEKSSTQLKKCFKYYDVFKQKTNAILPQLDPMLIMSIAYGESSCNPSPSGPTKFGGIMQVDFACLKDKKCHDENENPLVDIQIEEGLKVLKKEIDDLENEDLSGNEKIRLVLFGYNRGNSAKDLALKYFKENGDLTKSMIDSCFYYYKQRTDRNGNLLCSHYGYSEQYPVKIFDIFSKSCENVGGQLKGEIIDIEELKSDSYGTYSVTPNFKAQLNYDITIYDKIIANAKSLKECETQNDVEVCINTKITSINSQTSKYVLKSGSDCDNDFEKPFNTFYEDYTKCLNSPNNNCYCDVNISNFDENSKLISDDNFLYYEYNNNNLSQPKDKLTSFPVEIDFQNNLLAFKDILSGNKQELSTTSNNVKIYKNNQLSFGALNNNKIEFPFQNAIDISSITKCTPKLEIYRFCAISDDKFIVKNEYGQIQEEQLKYKFAIKIQDTVPPEIVKNAKVVDEKYSENSAIITWTYDPLADAKDFRIVYSKDDLQQTKVCCTETSCCNQETQMVVLNRSDVIDFGGKGLDFDDYAISLIKEAEYKIIEPTGANQREPLEKGILYKSGENWFTVVDLPEKEYYNYLITAKDSTGNDLLTQISDGKKEFIIQSENYATGTSIDDLPPSAPENLQIFFEPSSNITTVEFSKVTLNAKELPEKDADQLFYRIKFYTVNSGIESLYDEVSLKADDMLWIGTTGRYSGFDITPLQMMPNSIKVTIQAQDLNAQMSKEAEATKVIN